MFVLCYFQSLFEPIDPDKDTITTRQWNRRERLDSEFWLLQKLGQVMDKANFHKIPVDVVKAELKEKHSQEGLMVSAPHSLTQTKFPSLSQYP